MTARVRWRIRPQPDGWIECSGSVVAPSGGVLEWRAQGLTGCEVRFVFDGELGEARALREDLAQISRPVQPGRHVIGVQWRGPAAEPSAVTARFRYLTRTLAQLERDAPELAAMMKKNNPVGFVLCDAFILSQPQGEACQVYGVFTVDKRALRSGRAGAPVVKQDFLVHDSTVDPPEITYYTGLRGRGPHKRIWEFCARFGAPNYGCELVKGRWLCRDHHYALEEFDRLPGEPAFRDAIAAAIAAAED